jgi:hypothetical protein
LFLNANEAKQRLKKLAVIYAGVIAAVAPLKTLYDWLTDVGLAHVPWYWAFLNLLILTGTLILVVIASTVGAVFAFQYAGYVLLPLFKLVTFGKGTTEQYAKIVLPICLGVGIFSASNYARTQHLSRIFLDTPNLHAGWQTWGIAAVGAATLMPAYGFAFWRIRQWWLAGDKKA